MQLMKKGRSLRGSGTFLFQDLSKKEREKRKVLVTATKKARSEGKRVFITFSNGELIVNGKVYLVDQNPSGRIEDPPNILQEPPVQSDTFSV